MKAFFTLKQVVQNDLKITALAQNNSEIINFQKLNNYLFFMFQAGVTIRDPMIYMQV